MIFAAGFSILILNQAAMAADEVLSVRRPCTRTESWTYTEDILPVWQREMWNFLSHRSSSARAFSQAIALRRSAITPASRQFAEYWISRSLFEAGLVHIAHRGFLALLNQPATLTTAGVQAAALECLTAIHSEYPTLELGSGTARKLFELAPFTEQGTRLKQAVQPAVWSAATHFALTMIQESAPKHEIDFAIKTLKDLPRAQAYVMGISAASRGAHKEAAEALKKFLTTSGHPAILDRHVSRARLLLAHAYYSMRRYDLATVQLKLIPKTPGLMAEAISEIAWNQLMAENYKDAVGVARSMQQGPLRKAFAPEAAMVMAMALNELCQYPDAIRASQTYKRQYQATYKWLKEWEQVPARKRVSLYEIAAAYLRKSGVKIPDRVVNEWIQSPFFLARQEEINLTFQEQQAANRVSDQGAAEQGRIASEILKRATEFKRSYQLAKIRSGRMPASLTKDLDQIREQLRNYRRFQYAAPIWNQILESFKRGAPVRTTELTRAIDTDLGRLNARMLRQLEQVAENSYFIEVEIYNGAGKDLLWQEAHPDYKDIARQIASSEQNADGEVLKWGQSTVAAENQVEEVWEDELGGFRADVVDNCSSKDKYMNIKREQIVRRLQ